jgi:hypothetical protein
MPGIVKVACDVALILALLYFIKAAAEVEGPAGMTADFLHFMREYSDLVIKGSITDKKK